MILEDDVEISSELKNCLEEISQNLKPEQNTIIMVGPRAWNIDKNKIAVSENCSVVLRRTFSPYGTCGYIVTYEAARRLSNFLLPCRTVADDWGRFERYGLVKIWTTEPELVHLTEADNNSTIGTRTVRNDIITKIFRLGRRMTFEKIDLLYSIIYRLKHGYR